MIVHCSQHNLNRLTQPATLGAGQLLAHTHLVIWHQLFRGVTIERGQATLPDHEHAVTTMSS